MHTVNVEVDDGSTCLSAKTDGEEADNGLTNGKDPKKVTKRLRGEGLLDNLHPGNVTGKRKRTKKN